jgi:uncharacterized pyridoxamine 5'-phosphate oxidase family protein
MMLKPSLRLQKPKILSQYQINSATNNPNPYYQAIQKREVTLSTEEKKQAVLGYSTKIKEVIKKNLKRIDSEKISVAKEHGNRMHVSKLEASKLRVKERLKNDRLLSIF